MIKKERLAERNNQVRKLFYDTQQKNPKWRIDAVIEEVSNKMFLSNRTVNAIIKFEGTYNDGKKANDITEKVLSQFQ
jgi:hypothetical protein